MISAPVVPDFGRVVVIDHIYNWFGVFRGLLSRFPQGSTHEVNSPPDTGLDRYISDGDLHL